MPKFWFGVGEGGGREISSTEGFGFHSGSLEVHSKWIILVLNIDRSLNI